MRAILLPILALGVAISCIAGYVSVEVDYAAQRQLRVLIHQMAARATAIEPGEFRLIGERVLYVQHLDEGERLAGVVISDRSDPQRPLMIFAEFGQMDLDGDTGEVRFSLRNGSIHVDSPDDSEERYERISFLEFEYAFEMDRVLGLHPSRVRPAEMSMGELREVVNLARAGDSLASYRKKNPAEYEVQIHRRVALPLAPVLFALVGVPLGVRRRRGARSWGALLCAVLVFGYYAVLTVGQYLSVHGSLPAFIALWLPNATFAAGAIALLRRARRAES